METVESGQRVVRSKGDYVVGRKGTVINIDSLKNRAQVEWDGEKRTWVSFDSLELESIPYEIIPSKPYDGKKRSYPQYRRL